MTDGQKRIAIFPGTFDPITNGHLDVIGRGAKLFDELIVAVGENPQKKSMMPQQERASMIREIIVSADLPNVRVETFDGLTVDFARKVDAAAILRGIRDSSDLHFEFQVALTNRVVAGVETVFVITSTEHAFTSSSLIKQIASMGGDVTAMVPPQVLKHIQRNSTGSAPDRTIQENE
jgi:pantetheine-phosphate adenylyltransferase